MEIDSCVVEYIGGFLNKANAEKAYELRKNMGGECSIMQNDLYESYEEYLTQTNRK